MSFSDLSFMAATSRFKRPTSPGLRVKAGVTGVAELSPLERETINRKINPFGFVLAPEVLARTRAFSRVQDWIEERVSAVMFDVDWEDIITGYELDMIQLELWRERQLLAGLSGDGNISRAKTGRSTN